MKNRSPEDCLVKITYSYETWSDSQETTVYAFEETEVDRIGGSDYYPCVDIPASLIDTFLETDEPPFDVLFEQ
jgi:hypothetical protein